MATLALNHLFDNVQGPRDQITIYIQLQLSMVVNVNSCHGYSYVTVVITTTKLCLACHPTVTWNTKQWLEEVEFNNVPT